VSVRVGDLVQYEPFATTGAHGLGIVVRVAAPREIQGWNGEHMAEVLWAKYPGDGPQWYQIRNLRVESSPE
jgi:hypothetical protein